MNRPCPICCHANHQAIQIRPASGDRLIQIAATHDISIAALWRCRLNHIQDPTEHYDIDVASAQKARLLNKPEQKPMVREQPRTNARHTLQRIREALIQALQNIPGALPAALQALEAI
jgi:hypothetical protein